MIASCRLLAVSTSHSPHSVPPPVPIRSTAALLPGSPAQPSTAHAARGPEGQPGCWLCPRETLSCPGLLHVLRGLCSQPSPGLRQGLFLLCSCLLNTTWHCCVCTYKALPVLINAVGKTRLCINLLSLSFTPCFSRRARLVLTTFCKLMRADEQLCCALSHVCSCRELRIQPWG